MLKPEAASRRPERRTAPFRASSRAKRTGSCALLILALAICGAGDIDIEGGDRVSTYEPKGAFAAFLTGRFAALHSDLGTAADKLEAALTEDPGLPELAGQAFLAATLAGR